MSSASSGSGSSGGVGGGGGGIGGASALRVVHCASTHKLRSLQWNPQFARLIVELRDLSTVRPAHLRQMEKFIRVDLFMCRSKESELNALHSLLTLWNKLLKIIVHWWKIQKHKHKHAAPLHSNQSPSAVRTPTKTQTASLAAPPPMELTDETESDTTERQEIVPNRTPSIVTSSPTTSRHMSSPASPPPSNVLSSALKDKDIRLVFDLIDAIIARHEFDLIHLMPPNNTHAVVPKLISRQSQTVPAHGVANAQYFHANGSAQNNQSPRTPTHSLSANNSPTHIPQQYSNAPPALPAAAPISPSFSAAASISPRHPSPSSSHPTYLTYAEQLSFFQSYRSLLHNTVMIILKMFRQSEDGRLAMKHEHTSEAEALNPRPTLLDRSDFVWFVGRLLAIAFFRLPVLSGPLLDCITPPETAVMVAARNKLKPSDEVDDESSAYEWSWKHAMLLSIDRWMIAQSQAPSNAHSLGYKPVATVNRRSSWTVTNMAATTTHAIPSTRPALSQSSANTQFSMTQPTALRHAHAHSHSSDMSLSPQSYATLFPQQLSARSVRALSNLWLAANPSFFEWTKPELNRDTHTDHGDTPSSEPVVSDELTSDEHMLSASNLACIRALLENETVFFVFASGWLTHVHQTSNTLPAVAPSLPALPPLVFDRRSATGAGVVESKQTSKVGIMWSESDGVLWEMVPGYRILLHAALKRLCLESIEYVSADESEDTLDSAVADDWSELGEASLTDHHEANTVAMQKTLSLNRRQIDLEREQHHLALIQLKKESLASIRSILMRNAECRLPCLHWFTELALRHTLVTDKRQVERTLDTVDEWCNATLTTLSAQPNSKKLFFSVDSPLAHSSFSPQTLFSSNPRSPRYTPPMPSPSQLNSLSCSVSLPWIAPFRQPLYYAQLRERCLRAKAVQRFTLASPELACPLPPAPLFCHDLLVAALSMLLHQEHFQLLLKALTFIYMNSGHLYGDERREWFDRLVFDRELFGKLFFHWCIEVRRVFHAIIIYRVRRDGGMPNVVPGKPVTRQDAPPTVFVMIGGKQESVPALVEQQTQHKPAVSAPPSPMVSLPQAAAHTNTQSFEVVQPQSNRARPAVNRHHSLPTPHTDSAPADTGGWLSRIGQSLLSLVDSGFVEDPAGPLVSNVARHYDDNNEPRRSKSSPSLQSLVSSSRDFTSDENGDGVLQSGDPIVESCVLVVTRLDEDEMTNEIALSDKLDTFLVAVHRQYCATDNETVQSAAESTSNISAAVSSNDAENDEFTGESLLTPPLPCPSLRVPAAAPPASDVVLYYPHLTVYSAHAFTEFAQTLASFRRVQSQLSPSMQVSSSVADACLLPYKRAVIDERTQRRHSAAVEWTRLQQSRRRSHDPPAANGRITEDESDDENDDAVDEKAMASAGVEGAVLVPLLYYTIP